MFFSINVTYYQVAYNFPSGPKAKSISFRLIIVFSNEYLYDDLFFYLKLHDPLNLNEADIKKCI